MKVLITGGSGLIGRKLTFDLVQKGNEVVHLTRYRNSRSGVKTYEWDWENGRLDKNCFDGVTHIVHLAGASIAEKAWTMKRKKFLVDSRVETAKLLHKKINELNISIEAFISASAIGYYGARTVDHIFTESDTSYNDFMGKCCNYWEQAADEFQKNCRVVKLRTGIVLDKEQGALAKMVSPHKYGLGSPLGSGNQWMPWISINDLSEMYIFFLENNLEGVYNSVSESITNKEFTQSIAEILGKKIRIPNIPPFIIKGIYGELADVILEGSRISKKKVKAAGFEFEDNDLKLTLEKLFL